MYRKLLYVGNLKSDQKGAIGTHTAGILKALDDSPHCELVAAFFDHARPHYCPKHSYYFCRVIPVGTFAKILNIFLYSYFVWKVIRREKPDFVYLRFEPFYLPLMSLISGNLIVEYNDVFLDQINFALAKREWKGIKASIRSSILYRHYIQAVERFVFSRAKLIVAVTEGLAIYCKSIAPTANVTVVMNGTDVKSGKSSFSLNNESLVISHVGTLTYWDGLEELLEALALAITKRPDANFRLNIVGDGVLYQKLKDKVDLLNLQRTVFFRESVPHADAIALLNNSTDVVPLLKTINTYGLSPIKFYEGMACGCFIIASDIPHINELPQMVGHVVSFPLDTEEVSSALIACWENRITLRQRRQDIIDYAVKFHSWEARVETILRCIDHLT